MNGSKNPPVYLQTIACAIVRQRFARRSGRSGLLALGSLALLCGICRGQSLYNFGNPTAEEQLYLELINRARANPGAEGARLAATTDPDILAAYAQFQIDLAMMQSEFNAIAVAPPIAPNAFLTTSARSHSAWMLANATQSHDETNPANDPFMRMAAAGYSIAAAGENIYASTKNVWFGHVAFEVDWGYDLGGMQDPRGHRNIIHSGDYREVGVGVVNGSNGTTGPQLVTQDFGTSNANPTLGTGVAYYDLNGNDFYDIGEGISGLTVNVSGASYYCTTACGGGWVVPVPASGTLTHRTVTFTGLNVNQPVGCDFPAAQNAKADLKLNYAPPVITSSASADADTIHTLTYSPVGGATGYRWDRWTCTAAAAENCETTSNITATTTGSYAVLNTTVKQQGTAAFHLENTSAASQSIQLSPLYYGQASPALAFQSCIRWATTSELFKVQVREEGSIIWQDVFCQAGTSSSGESAFHLRTADLAAMAGKAFRIRFLLSYGGGGYYGNSGDTVGWFLDAIAFTGVATLGDNVCQTLTGTSGSFTPCVGSYLMAVTPVISNRNFPASYQDLTVSTGLPTPPAIVSQPASVVIAPGCSANFSVVAAGTLPTFQWYAGASGVTTNPVAGATTAAFTTPVLTTTASYWVKASNALGTAKSDTATATVIGPPLITTQPVPVTIDSGSTATFTIAASGVALTCQWYRGAPGDTADPAPGATGDSFTTPDLTTTTSYWVRVSNAAGNADSTAATATVTPPPAIPPPVITTQPASIAIKKNTATTLTVSAASGTELSYQWYDGIAPSANNPVSGATSASFTTPTLRQDANYWVCITNTGGSVNSSTAFVLIAVTPPAITAQPSPVTVVSGSTATFTVAASGTAPSYQWYVGSAGSTANPVAGATGCSFTTPPLTATSSYWVRASNGLGSANSTTVTATVVRPYAAWAANLEISNKLAAGTLANQPAADFDHDGRTNLMEYAFGCSPVIANDAAPRLPAARTTPTAFILQYQRDTALTDLIFTAEACAVPGNWKAPGEAGAPGGFSDVVIATSGTIQTREATVPRSSGNCFMRVRVTQP